VRVQPREPEVVEEAQGSGALGMVALAALLAYAGYAWGLNVVIIILAIIFMIFMHELGHYLTARWAGMKVTEFFIGFGPRIWSFRRGETEYGVKAIPAGAYVKIIGMSNLETDIDPSEEHRTYRAKSYGRKLSVALAGSTMHFLMALVLIVVVFAGFGEQTPRNWVIGSITEPSAALEAGVQLGDRVVSVDGRRFDDFRSMSEYLRDNPGERVELEVLRDGERLTLDATLGTRNPRTGEDVGFLGVGEARPYERVAPLTAVGRGIVESGRVIKMSVVGLAHLLSPDGVSGYVDTLTNPDADGDGAADVSEDRPSSIIGIVQIGDQLAENGWVNVLYLLFGVNIFIGLFNLLPVLPFDGGHVAIATYERIRSWRSGRRYEADVAKLLPLTYVVVLALALLFITTTYLDIAHSVRIQ